MTAQIIDFPKRATSVEVRTPTFKWHSLRPGDGNSRSTHDGVTIEAPSKEAVEVALFRRLSAALDLFLAHNGTTITEEALKSLIKSRDLKV